MDMERPLKFQGEFFGVETDSGFQECFNEMFIQNPEHQCSEYSHSNTGCDS